jgi:1-phosphofructokinase
MKLISLLGGRASSSSPSTESLDHMVKKYDIVTVTLNPAIDQTVFIQRFVPGAVNRVHRSHRQAGGKGVNVSALLGRYGVGSTATGFLGQSNDEPFVELFSKADVTDDFIRLPGETRTGIKIIDESTNETTDINFPGLQPSEVDIRVLKTLLSELVEPGRWFVLGGSLPAGIEVEVFGELLALLKRGGAQVAVDTSGPALAVAIEGGADLIKPNEHELAEYLGRPLGDLSSQVDAAREIQRTKVPRVILSLGGEGALFITPEGELLASAPPVEVLSTVGAGDSLLAGYLAGLATDRGAEDCARLATVFAWCVLEDLSRELPAREVLERRMSEIRTRVLS